MNCPVRQVAGSALQPKEHRLTIAPALAANRNRHAAARPVSTALTASGQPPPGGSKANETLARYNGMSAEAHVGKAVAEVVPHFWPALKPLYERALAGETIANQEISARCGDASVHKIHRRVNCFPIVVGHEIVVFGVIIIDTVAERRAETHASRVAAVVESSDDAIVATDLDGIITSWNTGAQRIFGYVAEEIVGSPITVDSGAAAGRKPTDTPVDPAWRAH